MDENTFFRLIPILLMQLALHWYINKKEKTNPTKKDNLTDSKETSLIQVESAPSNIEEGKVEAKSINLSFKPPMLYEPDNKLQDIPATSSYNSLDTKACKGCGKNYPKTAEFFGHTPKGNLRGKCKTCMRTVTKYHYDLNPQNTKDRAAKYNRQKAQAKGNYTQSDIDAIRKKLDDKCYYCNSPLNNGGEVG